VRTMGYATQELLEELRRLEDENSKVPSSGDVRRDDQSPVVTTYYGRFGGTWRNVELVYERWKQVGEEWDQVNYGEWRESVEVEDLPRTIPKKPSQKSIVRQFRDQY